MNETKILETPYNLWRSLLLFGILFVTLAIAIDCRAKTLFGNWFAKEANVKCTGQLITKIHHFGASNFDAVVLDTEGELQVELIRGEPNSKQLQVTMDVNLSRYIDVYIKNGVLYFIKKEKIHFPSHATCKITITTDKLRLFTVDGACDTKIRNVKELDFTVILKGAGDINIASVDAQSLNIRLEGSGKITTKVDVKNLTVLANGHGDTTLSGNTNTLTLELNGAGDIDTSALKARDAKVVLEGVGNITTHAAEKISLGLKGVGSIKYFGAPQKIFQHHAGIGKIVALDS